ncbi:heparan-alpha-glucosaminide N-acetyltransferase [Ischnura elegans]|uniref:heparan-alpha-glucosaminide N-acetyltransferase n=1 Tax=Ischnura elegans TaxID=197161 RepID=UPI001ED8688A|nr:heparan-alpha-glucosaminide N-acetyltransferase [Ischnura elegans]XP_046391760.1 heparan-alpha-glucosaminide N-acetyltransferase [Ischnura elegans]XP_046391761.1 heparan-alpha-glucosaminide N-acetyltransferase [Ischnura elegans]
MSWVEVANFDRLYGHSSRDLGMDEAYLRVLSSAPRPLTLLALSQDCHQCQYTSFAAVPNHTEQVLKVDTKFATTFKLASIPFQERDPFKGDGSVVCDVDPLGSATRMGEFGFYELTVNDTVNGTVSCQLRTLVEPVNTYLSLLLIVLIVAFTIIAWKVLRCAPKLLGKRCLPVDSGRELSSGPAPDDEKGATAKKRLKSLDTFRGISIIVMVFVNYGGGGYWFLDHATWNGLQIADLVFPWFMWIMGVCIPISVRSTLRSGASLTAAILNVIRRAVILFGLGLMLNTAGRGADFGAIRIFGVLQRFGVTYFVVTTFAIILAPKNKYQTAKKEGEMVKQDFWDAVVDVTSLKFQWAVMLVVLAAHCLITFLLPVPGCPRGYLGPGGIELGGQFKGCAGGATGYIDRVVLGVNHIYQNPTSNHVYHAGPFDPEGILGCLLSVFQVFLGVQAGAVLLFHSSHRGRLVRWLSWSALTGIVGAVLCLASKDDGFIPLNKNLWSLSFVMVTSCFAFFLLSACYVLVDIKGWWSGAPFFYPGMNATIMYVGHSLAYDLFPWHWKFPGLPMNTHFINTIEALWGTGLWVLIAFMLFRKKFFLSI